MSQNPWFSTLQQLRVDDIQTEARKDEARKRLFKPPPERPADLLKTSDIVSLRLAEELEYIRRLVEALGDALVSDPIVVTRHGNALQSFDIIGQTLGHLSSVMSAKDQAAAIERIGMDALKRRLDRKTLF